MTIDLPYVQEILILVLKGIPTTLRLTFIPLLIALPFAFLIAVARQRNIKILARVSQIYVSFIRGTPLIVQILVMYSLFPSLLNVLVKSLGLDYDVFGINPIYYAYIVFTLNTIAILSEVFRSALETVDKRQLEAALSIGLLPVQAYSRIVIPQALVAATPNLCNSTVNLLKSTSLAFLMSVQDITAIAKTEAAFGYNYLESYLVIFIVYIVLCSLVQVFFQLLEQRLSLYKRGRKMTVKSENDNQPEYFEGERKERYHAGIEEYS